MEILIEQSLMIKCDEERLNNSFGMKMKIGRYRNT